MSKEMPAKSTATNQFMRKIIAMDRAEKYCYGVTLSQANTIGIIYKKHSLTMNALRRSSQSSRPKDSENHSNRRCPFENQQRQYQKRSIAFPMNHAELWLTGIRIPELWQVGKTLCIGGLILMLKRLKNPRCLDEVIFDQCHRCRGIRTINFDPTIRAYFISTIFRVISKFSALMR